MILKQGASLFHYLFVNLVNGPQPAIAGLVWHDGIRSSISWSPAPIITLYFGCILGHVHCGTTTCT